VKKLIVSNIYGASDRKPVSKGEQGKLGMQEAEVQGRGAKRAESWCNACQCEIVGSKLKHVNTRRHRENFLRYQQGKAPL
jgi:hypothetical protein